MQEHLERYAQIMQQLGALNEEVRIIKAELEHHVLRNGEVAGFGVRVYMKAGRKSTNHEEAAVAAKVPVELIEKHSTTKTTVAWAKVTKDAGVNIAPFTTEGAPVFVIEIL